MIVLYRPELCSVIILKSQNIISMRKFYQ